MTLQQLATIAINERRLGRLFLEYRQDADPIIDRAAAIPTLPPLGASNNDNRSLSDLDADLAVVASVVGEKR